MEKGGVPHLPGDPGEEAEAKARGKEEEAEEGRPHGALGEGVDRLDDPASGEEGAEKGGGEGQGHEGKVPGLEGPRVCWTKAVWRKAVARSQGMKLAFSTGSQAQYPPQPRTS